MSAQLQQPLHATSDINSASTTLGSKREVPFGTDHRRADKRQKPTTMSATAEERVAKATELINKDIAEHKVVVYAKTWCPHCQETKKLLQSAEYKEVDVLIRDLDVMDDPTGPCLAKALKDKTDQSSVPNIFIDGKHLGGNSDLQQAHASGTLKLV